MKQSKKGTKGKKGFFKSKKSLVAAALAALIALAGVTYAWFTWSVGLTGGTLKMDYVQIDAQFGVYVKLNEMFKNYARYFESKSVYGPPVVVAEPTSFYSGTEVVYDDVEFFIPFDFFQEDNTFASSISTSSELIDYLKATLYEPLLYDAANDMYYDAKLGGKAYYDILKDYNYRIDGPKSDPLYPVFIDGFNDKVDLLNIDKDTSQYTYLELGSNVASATDAMIDDNAFMAALFNRYVTHELPSDTLEVGYRIKNLGAACYINIPNMNKNVRISQATAAAPYAPPSYGPSGYYEYRDGTKVSDPDLFVRPAWGVAKYGNYVVGDDTYGADLGGWEKGVAKGTYATGYFDDDSYTALYGEDALKLGKGVPEQVSLGAIVAALTNIGTTTDYGITLAERTDLAGNLLDEDWGNFAAWYKFNPDFRLPIDVINKAYAVSARELYDGISGYDIYPLTVTTPWAYPNGLEVDVNGNPIDDQTEWEINVFPTDRVVVSYEELAALAVGEVTITVSDSTVYEAINGSNELLDEEYKALTDGLALEPFYTGVLGDDYISLKNLYPQEKNEFTAWAYLFYRALDVGDLVVVDGSATNSALRTRTYDLELLTNSKGFTVLHVQGTAFTYKTLETAPSINLKYTVKYGSLLDNRFVGSELYFEDAGVVAVQNTPTAAYDVFVLHGDKSAVDDVSWFYSINGKGIILDNISNLPNAYKFEVNPNP